MTAPNNEWQEIELTADTGACNTDIPRTMCESIPVVPSMQSLNGMEYEVASGSLWAGGASSAKSIIMQVADVHKALLSLSRCAEMGFESRFGSSWGCLIDTQAGEIIPLQRRGNLYMLKAWIRPAPFGRQDRPR